MINTEDEDTGSLAANACADLAAAAVIIFVGVRPVLHALHGHFFLEPDSIGYMSLARNLWHGKGFKDFSGTWCSDWPPFYPLILGICQKVMHNRNVPAFGLCGGICLALTLTFANLWLHKCTSSALLRLSVVAALAFSLPLTNLANSGLSEILFLPLSVACIYFMGRWQDDRNEAFFVLTTITALLVCMTRYIGVTLVAACLTAIVFDRNLPLLKRAARALTLASCTMLPFFAWCLVNKWLSGTMMGERAPGTNTLHDCLIALVNCFGDIFVQPIYIVLLLGAALCGIVLWILTPRENVHPYLRLAPVFLLYYAVVLVYSSARYNIDMIDDRLAAPLIVPLIGTAVSLIEVARTAFIRSVADAIAYLLSAFFLLAGYQALPQPQIPDDGYLSAVWQRSETLAYVRRTSFPYPLNSNDSAAAFFIGQKSADWIADDNDTPSMADVEADLNTLDAPCYVIWLENAIEPANFDPNQIVAKCNMQIVASFNDGIIFEKAGAPSAAASAN